MKVVSIIFTLFCLLLVGQLMISELSAFEIAGKDETLMHLFLSRQGKYIGGGSFEPVSFRAKLSGDSQGYVTREGILLKRPGAKGTVLICHGFMCNKTDTAFLRSFFPEFNVMSFDFRGHGANANPKDLCTFGKDEAYDVIAAVDYLRSRKDLLLDQQPLIAYGFSMGAVSAIQAQSMHPHLFDALILDCPYDRSINIIKRGLENLQCTIFGYTFDLPGKAFLERFAFHPFIQGMLKQVLKTIACMDATATKTQIFPLAPAESIQKISVPCFFIHCMNDEKVSAHAARTLYEGAQGYKRLWLTAGRRHYDSIFYNPEKYLYKLGQFLGSISDGSWKTKSQHKVLVDALVS